MRERGELAIYLFIEWLSHQIFPSLLTLYLFILAIRIIYRKFKKDKHPKYISSRDPYYIKFMKSDYRHASGNSYEETYGDKGKLGEYLIYLELESLQIIKTIHVNAYIPKKNGTSEIDLIMVSEYGIHVFESKNYSGSIYGNETNSNWTQVLNEKSNFNFFNPIWQNNSHITALRDFLKLDNKDLYKSFIIFSERCVLKDVIIHNKKIKVVNRNELKSILTEELNKSEKVLSINQIKDINKKLKPHILVSESLKKQHIERVQNAAKYYQTVRSKDINERITEKKCPLCNSNLVLRTAKRGANKGNKFIGCNNFPRCNYIENI